MPLILRQRGLNFAPGEEWSYSNSGYVLLTDLVGRTSAKLQEQARLNNGRKLSYASKAAAEYAPPFAEPSTHHRRIGRRPGFRESP